MEKDHPRACGENPAGRTCSAGLRGSPPRVRGKLLFISSSLLRHRITPARAGKTLLHNWTKRLPQDHPRACGEN